MPSGQEILSVAISQAAAAAGSKSELARRLGVDRATINKWVARGCVPAQYVRPIAAVAGAPYTVEYLVMAGFLAKLGE
jgi:DNA-binding transcriptional regulator YdaS (Cro superfamily)